MSKGEEPDPPKDSSLLSMEEGLDFEAAATQETETNEIEQAPAMATKEAVVANPPPPGNPPVPEREPTSEDDESNSSNSSTSNTESSESSSESSESDSEDSEEDSDADEPVTPSKSKSKSKSKKGKREKPEKPKMGRLVYVGRGQYEVQVGGVPNYKWTKIAKLPESIHTNNYLLRAQSSKNVGSQDLRRKGIDLKLKPSVAFSTWAAEIVQRAKQHGMETILYVQKPSKKTKMINVALHPGFFPSLKAIQTVVAEREPHLDNYDKGNDEDLRYCILNSISPSLLSRLRLQLPKDKPERAVVILIRLSHMHGKHDSALIEAMEKRIEGRLPSQFTGEDIAEMNKQTLEDALTLENSDKYRPELTLKYLRNLLLAGGEPSVSNPGRERFCRRLYPLEEKLEKALLKTSHKSYASQARYFAKKNLTLQDNCAAAEGVYNELISETPCRWYPARQRQDSRAPPRNFGANVVTLNGDALSAVPNNGAGFKGNLATIKVARVVVAAKAKVIKVIKVIKAEVAIKAEELVEAKVKVAIAASILGTSALGTLRLPSLDSLSVECTRASPILGVIIATNGVPPMHGASSTEESLAQEPIEAKKSSLQQLPVVYEPNEPAANVADEKKEPANDADEQKESAHREASTVPLSRPFSSTMTRQVSSSSQQVSLQQRPPLATATSSTASAMRFNSNNNNSTSFPPPLRSRLESSATASSRHRARAHESFAFSVDSLQLIIDETLVKAIARDRQATAVDPSMTLWSQPSQEDNDKSPAQRLLLQLDASLPMNFVDLTTGKLERDCSALPVDLDGDEEYSFDYSSSDGEEGRDTSKPQQRGTLDKGMTAAGADGFSQISSTSLYSLSQKKKQREYSPTSVVKIDEQVPSWMLEWTGQQPAGTATEPLLVETEEVTLTKVALPPVMEEGAYSNASSSYGSSLMEPVYLVPGAKAGEDGIVVSAWMAASPSDTLVTKREVDYDNVVDVVVYQDGTLVGRQYADHVLFRIDLRGKSVRSEFVSNEMGHAVVVEDIADQSALSDEGSGSGFAMPLCTLLPVSLPPRIFLDDQGKLVDEEKFEKFRYAMTAPFEPAVAAVDDEEKKADDAEDGLAAAGGAGGSDDAENKNPVQLYKRYAPDEQQDAMMHLLFLLDAQCRQPFDVVGS